MTAMKQKAKSIPIEIKRLGAVNSAKIELKPLTVFVGENNTGKTYSAYIIGYIFSKHSLLDFLNLYFKGKISTKFPELESVINEIFKTGKGRLNLEKFITLNTEKFFSIIIHEIVPKKFNTFLASDTVTFEKMGLKVNLNCLNEIQHENLSKYVSDYVQGINEATIGKDIKVSLDKKECIFTFSKNAQLTERSIVQQFVYFAAFMTLQRSIFNDVYFLGAERTGLTLFIHSMKIKDNATDTEIEKLRKQFIKAQTPINGEFNIKLSNHVQNLVANYKALFEKSTLKFRESNLSKRPGSRIFLKYAEILEEKILGGDLSFKKDAKNHTHNLIFGYNTRQKIPLNMPISSSSVKGLSPLVMYLKYYVEPDELLIIDEPEMNLHPKAQAEIIELISMLVNSGVHVLITTHSPYIVDHLKNLMKAKEVKNQKNAEKLFYLQDSSAFISKKDVSIYVFENGRGSNILSKTGEINWRTFSRVSEDIVKISLDLED